ncbi:uncharacterized protein LOC115029847 [Mus caroli]|uniref:Uncharacterized protein LOC115029847 n=1 Tax=Mus caroli TaxID=10089 RepID=A0A6P7QPM3_MUSCR|nr:uncharacterized protein LOC115029847 [Mus caroli]
MNTATFIYSSNRLGTGGEVTGSTGIRWQERHMTESELTGGLERPNLSCWLGRPPLHHPHSGMWSEAAPRLLALEGKDACQHTGSYFSHFCGQRKSPTWRYCTESKLAGRASQSFGVASLANVAAIELRSGASSWSTPTPIPSTSCWTTRRSWCCAVRSRSMLLPRKMKT